MSAARTAASYALLIPLGLMVVCGSFLGGCDATEPDEMRSCPATEELDAELDDLACDVVACIEETCPQPWLAEGISTSDDFIMGCAVSCSSGELGDDACFTEDDVFALAWDSAMRYRAESCEATPRTGRIPATDDVTWRDCTHGCCEPGCAELPVASK